MNAVTAIRQIPGLAPLSRNDGQQLPHVVSLDTPPCCFAVTVVCFRQAEQGAGR